jgi:hypothetical protein
MLKNFKAWCFCSQANLALFYWQTRSQREADFDLYRESALYALEVKYTQKVPREDLAALNSFAED